MSWVIQVIQALGISCRWYQLFLSSVGNVTQNVVGKLMIREFCECRKLIIELPGGKWVSYDLYLCKCFNVVFFLITRISILLCYRRRILLMDAALYFLMCALFISHDLIKIPSVPIYLWALKEHVISMCQDKQNFVMSVFLIFILFNTKLLK